MAPIERGDRSLTPFDLAVIVLAGIIMAIVFAGFFAAGLL